MSTDERRPRRRWVFVLAAALFVALIIGLVINVFILPMLRFERLDLDSYYWVAVPEKGVRQAVLRFANSGTNDLFIDHVLVDGTNVDSSCYGGKPSLEVQSTYGTWLYVAPANATFVPTHACNITIVTQRGRAFSYATEIRENNTVTESIEVTDCLFYHSPPGSSRKVVGATVRLLSDTDTIVKKMWIDGSSHSIEQQVWLYHGDSELDVTVPFAWVNGTSYTVAIETAAGSKYEVNATAIFP